QLGQLVLCVRVGRHDDEAPGRQAAHGAERHVPPRSVDPQGARRSEEPCALRTLVVAEHHDRAADAVAACLEACRLARTSRARQLFVRHSHTLLVLTLTAVYAGARLMQAGTACSSSSSLTRPASPKSTRAWPRTSGT